MVDPTKTSFPARVITWVQLAALSMTVAGTVVYGGVRLVGLETTKEHNEDMEVFRMEVRALQRQNDQIWQTLQCLLWEVPADRCAAAPLR